MNTLFNRFRVGDKVTYVGYKFAQKLSGSLGEVASHVQGSDCGVVVVFGDDSYVMDQYRHLAPFQGKVKETSVDSEVERPKDVEVFKRKGKRTAASEDE
jgi:hypothetical protein